MRHPYHANLNFDKIAENSSADITRLAEALAETPIPDRDLEFCTIDGRTHIDGWGYLDPRNKRRNTHPYGYRVTPGFPRNTECAFADMVFIADTIWHIDLLEHVGYAKVPKKKDKCELKYLVMSPEVADNENIRNIIADLKAAGKVCDIRDVIETGEFVIHEEEIQMLNGQTRIDRTYEWRGPMSFADAEVKIAQRLSEIVSSVRGNVIEGWRSDKWGAVKDIHCVLNIANALMMDKDFISLPTAAKGKKIGAGGIWGKVAKEHQVDFSHAAFDEQANELWDKVSQLEDVVRFWWRARADWRFAVLLDEDEFNDAQFVFDKMYAMGHLVGVDDYIKTWSAGVPADDILA